jgi:lipoprotein-releasing system permease protein
MSLKTEFFIACRYLKAKRKEKFISITAIFSFIGIMIGVATLIIVMSIMNGFREDLIKRVIGINAHVTVFLKNNSQEKYNEIMKSLENVEGIAGINPLIESQGMFLNDKKTSGGIVKAIKLQDFKKKTDIYNSIKNIDKIEDFENSNYIFIGKNLALNLDLDVGDDMKLISPEMNSTIIGSIPKIKTYEVGGIFESGLQEYDSMTVFIPLKMGQLQFGYKNSVSSIEIFLDNVHNSSKKHYEIQNILYNLNYDFYSVDWKDINVSFIEALNIERNVMFVILSLIIVIATFNIISSLTMLVMDKSKQIALLKTIGMTNGSIMNIFFICGSIIGALGTFFGSVIGILFSLNITSIEAFLEKIFNINLFDPSVYYLTRLPSKLLFSNIALIIVMSLVLSFLSTIYPARKAAKINPADALRYE